ncbi:hypothetical protein CGZ93_17705 [Enemella dayhoffiae]|uniref:LysM domain-containing protein n=1 Tax=Enemella dayhoffiae TaxID=2016507 RepID=A0A255GPV1_9ACTN|nr:LysM peptidoglycan-binding domain-containing protein [Enemella dayhoffiae]OYO16596.1 hypothetical protein CGZ93_17705 [Enemella dayhoffiae]
MRFVRGVAALLLLIGLVGGVPWVLLRVGRLSQLARLWRDFPEVLLTPDNGAILLGALTVLGWAAWAVFTLSVLSEIVRVLSRQRIRITLPGLGRPQAAMSVLVLSVAAMIAAPAVSHAQPPPAHTRSVPAPDHVGQRTPAPTPAVPERSSPQSDQWQRHRVQRGESLWSIAEQHYGDGRMWAKIAAANQSLIDDPDEIEIGWLLALPGIPKAPPAKPAPAEPPPAPGAVASDPPAAVPSGQPAPAAPSDESASAAAYAPAEQLCAVGVSGPATATDPLEEQQAALAPAARIALGVAGISSLTAAALLGVVATRRRTQLTQRPLGRQLLPLTPPQRHLEAALGQAQDPLSLTVLNLALRALGRHYREAGESLPGLGAVLVDDDRISVKVDRVPATLPPGFHADATHLWLDRDGGAALVGADALADEPCPYPSVVCLGELADGTLLLHDLETIGLLGLSGDADTVAGVFGSLLLELSSSWWGSGQSVTVIGGDAELVLAIDQPEVRTADDLDTVLSAAARHPAPDAHPRDLRCRPQLAEAWRPRVLLIGQTLTPQQRRRLADLTDSGRVVAVVADDQIPGAELVAPPELSSLPNQIDFIAQRLLGSTRDSLVGLLERTRSPETRPAPWWSAPGSVDEPRDPVAAAYAEEPDRFANVTPLGPRRADRRTEEPAAMDAHEPVLHAATPAGAAQPPMVLLVGPIELVGAVGETPNRARRQCIEYCAWLLENPNATSAMMTNALFVAETTRRSNMSRLRGWLGLDPTGEPYLPDAYSGRISLHGGVSSDWHRLQLLTIGGVDRAADGHLVQALELVRGAPLADAAPGQWHWAEELRSDISSMVRDVGLVLSQRALERGDLDLARWATNRALVAAPEDERLLCARVRTEHRANNVTEVERLALRMVRHARRLNVDLDEETVELLQQVMEGQPRGRVLPA